MTREEKNNLQKAEIENILNFFKDNCRFKIDMSQQIEK